MIDESVDHALMKTDAIQKMNYALQKKLKMNQ